MNKKLFLAASILALGGLVAACGSDDSSEERAQNTASETEQAETETAASEESSEVENNEEESSDEENAEQDTAETETTEESTEPSQENPALDEGALTVSDSQSYELYLLPGYELTAEEPNKDVIFSTENDALFMRVETFSTEEADFAFAEDSMMQTLQASNEEAELKELPAFDGTEFINSSLAEISTETGKVTGVAFEKENLIVRLTIFDQTDASVTEDFLNMGKTIAAQ